MSERLAPVKIASQENNQDGTEAHDPALSARFGSVVIEAMGAQAFTLPTLEEVAKQQPFGVDLTEVHEGVEAALPTDTDMATRDEGDEKSKAWTATTDWN